MRKIKIGLNDLVLDVKFTEAENKSKSVSKEMLKKIHEALLEEIKKEDVLKGIIKSFAYVNSKGLSSAKVGDIVENPDAKFDTTKYGVVVKINQKTIDVVFKNGVLRGPKESFESCDKTYKDIKWVSPADYIGYVGQFGTLKYKNKEYDCILNHETPTKTHFYLFELDTVLTIKTQFAGEHFTLLK